MQSRPRRLWSFALLAATIVTASCAKQSHLDVSPATLHLRAHGVKGEFVLHEPDYSGLYFKTTSVDTNCPKTIYATPEPRAIPAPAHVSVTPLGAGHCDIIFFDDHGTVTNVAVDVAK